MKRFRKASLTIEAVWLIPIVFSLIWFLIEFSFYLHDQCVLQVRLDEIAHKANEMHHHRIDLETDCILYEEINHTNVLEQWGIAHKKQEQQIKQYLLKELKRGLLITKIQTVNLYWSQKQLWIQIRAKGNAFFIRNILLKEALIKLQTKIKWHDPVEDIRKWQRAEEIMQRKQ